MDCDGSRLAILVANSYPSNPEFSMACSFRKVLRSLDFQGGSLVNCHVSLQCHCETRFCPYGALVVWGHCNIGGMTLQLGYDIMLSACRIHMHQDYYTMSGETSQLERVANFAHL